MEKKFKIRPVKWEDFHDLVEAFFSYHDELKDNPAFGLSISTTKKPSMQSEVDWWAGFYRGILDKTVVASVAEVDGKAVGMCDVHGRLRSNAHVGVLGISVRKEYRDLGLGQALMKDVIKRSRGNFEIVTLQVLGGNARAKHVYEKMGFRQMGTLKNGIKRGKRYFDEEEMYLNLKKFR